MKVYWSGSEFAHQISQMLVARWPESSHLTSALSPSGVEREKRRSTLRHALTSFQFAFGEGLDGQGQELREEWVVGFVGFAQF